MNKEALVEEIAREVFARLQQKNATQNSSKMRAVVVSTNKLDSLEQQLSATYQTLYYEPGMHNCDLVILPELSIKLLSDLANGICQEEAEHFILMMLLKGRKVIVVDEGVQYRKFKKSAPPMLFKQYEEYEEKLRSFGVQFAPFDDLYSAATTSHFILQQKVAETAMETKAEPCKREEVQTSTASAEILNKKLITESDLRRCGANHLAEIVIGTKSIITPLAYDFIRTNRIRVRRA